ncbi:NlpC/P60 family protein [Kurthia sp. Dielmo]|uniref:C40 family peptidase n=1 Tax=Kurthia sp. Dielmo TaxID=1033738 RepID=UPI0002F98705|nr:NlpC/P60 family protein [Kurthia sp. Dielmo]
MMKKTRTMAVVLTAVLATTSLYPVASDAKTSTQLTADKKEIDVQIKALEKEMTTMTQQFDTYVAQYDALQEELLDSEADIAVTKEELSDRQQIIAKRMKAYQAQDSTFSPYVEAFLGADSFTDLVTRTLSVKKIIDADESMRIEQHAQSSTFKKQHTALVKKEKELEQQFQMMQQQYEEMTVKRAENKAASLALKEKIATKKEKEKLVRKQKKAAKQAAKLKKMQEQQQAAIEKAQAEAAAAAQQQARTVTTDNTDVATATDTTETADATKTTDTKAAADTTINTATVSTEGGNAGNTNFGAKTTDADQQTPTVEGSATAKGIIAEASKYMGTAYVWGGNKPSTGFDCSGLTSWSFKENGVTIPRTAAQQYAASTKISASEAKAGDLVFFSYGKGVAHVGIYLGDGRMLNSQNRGVTIDKLAGHWSQYIVGYGRFAGVN